MRDRVSQPDQPVLVEWDRAGRIVTVTLARDRTRNALSRDLVAALCDALQQAAAEAVAVVVLTHVGSTFCAGADLVEVREHGMEQASHELMALLRAIVALPVPVVARIDGAVRAGGLGLVGACDIAVASDRSTFAFTEVRLGLAPVMISATTVPRMRPRDIARYYLTGETLDAAAAVDAGLLTASAPEVDQALSPILDGLRLGSPQGLRETKSLINAPILSRLDGDAAHLAAWSARLFGSEEAAEGMRAFAQKRRPWWQEPQQ